jgi:hypothetical protein
MTTITKGELVTQAFQRLMISGITSTPSTQEVSIALNDLESMMAQWLSNIPVVDIGFTPVLEDTDVDPNDESGLTNNYILVVTLKLAELLAANYGKMLPLSLLTSAKQAFEGIMPITPPEMGQNPLQPAGQGFERTAYAPTYMQADTE